MCNARYRRRDETKSKETAEKCVAKRDVSMVLFVQAVKTINFFAGLTNLQLCTFGFALFSGMVNHSAELEEFKLQLGILYAKYIFYSNF